MAKPKHARESKPKNQHYVAQSYLLRFARNEQIWVYDKPTGRSFPSNVKNVASETHFYDIPAETVPLGIEVDLQHVEKMLGDIDTAANNAMGTLIERLETTEAGGQCDIPDDERYALTYFMATQVIRTKEFRTWTSELESKAEQAILDVFAKSKGYEAGRFSLKKPKHIDVLRHIQAPVDPNIAKALYDCLTEHIWVIGVNATPMPLYTSDNPLATWNPIRRVSLNGSGFCSPSVEVSYPLSSKYTLVMYDRASFGLMAHLDGKRRALSDANVKAYNTLQVMQSRRHVYCEAPEFGLVEELCNQYPDICDPDRGRVQVYHG